MNIAEIMPAYQCRDAVKLIWPHNGVDPSDWAKCFTGETMLVHCIVPKDAQYDDILNDQKMHSWRYLWSDAEPDVKMIEVGAELSADIAAEPVDVVFLSAPFGFDAETAEFANKLSEQHTGANSFAFVSNGDDDKAVLQTALPDTPTVANYFFCTTNGKPNHGHISCVHNGEKLVVKFERIIDDGYRQNPKNRRL